MAIRDYIEVRDNLGALLVGVGLFAIPALALGVIPPEHSWLRFGVILAGTVLGCVGAIVRRQAGGSFFLGLAFVVATIVGGILSDTLVHLVSGRFGMAGLIVVILVLGWWAARENAKVDE
jgi:FtsH-binding integral membrane protein